MNGKSFFVDLTLCTACRGCQVACKQWKDLPAEQTRNLGSHQNPQDLFFQNPASGAFFSEGRDKKGKMQLELLSPSSAATALSPRANTCSTCTTAGCRDPGCPTPGPWSITRLSAWPKANGLNPGPDLPL